MLVIADSSPLIVLVNIGLVDLLPRLFGQVVIPPARRGRNRITFQTSGGSRLRRRPAFVAQDQDPKQPTQKTVTGTVQTFASADIRSPPDPFRD